MSHQAHRSFFYVRKARRHPLHVLIVGKVSVLFEEQRIGNLKTLIIGADKVDIIHQ